MQLKDLAAGGVRFAEGSPVGEGFEVGAVDVHLELVARFRVESRLDVRPGDGGVDVHDEHSAVVAVEYEQVIDVELTVLPGQRRIEMVRHSAGPPPESPSLPALAGTRPPIAGE